MTSEVSNDFRIMFHRNGHIEFQHRVFNPNAEPWVFDQADRYQWVTIPIVDHKGEPVATGVTGLIKAR
jgi:hypothetical protein